MSAPKLILIVDDHDHVARFLAKLVEVTTAFNAVSALDGPEALRLAARRRPDAVLLDVDTAAVDGAATARALHAMFPADRPLLIGMSSDIAAVHSDAARFLDFTLAKPVDLVRLLPLLQAGLPPISP